MNRRILLCSLACALTLTACGGSSGKTEVTCAQQFWNGSVAVCLPEGWKVLSKESLGALGVSEETIAAFQYETPHAGQLDTVTVTREPLAQDMSTKDYSAANIVAVSALPEYKLLNKETVTIDGEESALHVFTARPSPSEPVRRYYQVSMAKDKVGYTLTGSFPLSIEDSEAAQVEFILKNASMENPSTETK